MRLEKLRLYGNMSKRVVILFLFVLKRLIPFIKPGYSIEVVRVHGVHVAPVRFRVARLKIIRACSSSGRALHSHCRGKEFESPQVHLDSP